MNYKLVCFDLDGTIIDKTIFIWHTLHDALGTSKEWRQKGIDDYESGKITYAEWAKHDIEGWKKVGATKQKIKEALKPLKLMNGAKEVLETLKKQGIKLALISGSINTALEHVIPNYKDYFDYVFINNVIYDEQGNVQDIEATKYDLKHKASGLKLIAEKENIDVKDCVFIGDHHNDIHIAELAGLSIAFNCKSDALAQIADHLIMEKDLRLILPHIISQ